MGHCNKKENSAHAGITEEPNFENHDETKLRDQSEENEKLSKMVENWKKDKSMISKEKAKIMQEFEKMQNQVNIVMENLKENDIHENEIEGKGDSNFVVTETV